RPIARRFKPSIYNKNQVEHASTGRGNSNSFCHFGVAAATQESLFGLNAGNERDSSARSAPRNDKNASFSASCSSLFYWAGDGGGGTLTTGVCGFCCGCCPPGLFGLVPFGAAVGLAFGFAGVCPGTAICPVGFHMNSHCWYVSPPK